MALSCPRCYAKLPEPAPRCPNCSAKLEALTFVATSPAGGNGSVLSTEGGAECFTCAGEPASGSCAGCGRFVCARCEVDWAGQKTCLTCLHAGRELRSDDRFVTKRTLWDGLALNLVVWPPFIIPFYGIFFSLLAAPAAIFIVLKNWNAPRGIVPRGRACQIAALALSVLALCAVTVGTLWIIGLSQETLLPDEVSTGDEI